MTYVTRQDMITTYGELDLVRLTDRDAIPPAVIVDDVLNKAIADAAGFADGYVAKAYTLPLAVVPAALSRAVADIAWYYLHGKAVGKDEPVAIGYRDAVVWLKDVARGTVTLDVGAQTPAPAGGGSIRATPNQREFTRNSLRGL